MMMGQTLYQSGRLVLLLVPWMASVLFFLRRKQGWVQSAIRGSLLWTGLVIVGTEGLGLWNWLSPRGLIAWWIFLSTVSIISILTFYHRKPFAGNPDHPPQRKLPDLSRHPAIVTALAGVILVTGFLAFTSFPNSIDGLTYHFSRVEHWLQNHSLDFYPTNIGRQLYANPLAEFFLLQVRGLTGSDRFMHLVQWFAFLACGLGILYIHQGLGGESREGLFALAFAGTLPMAILQSTSGQNDLVNAFFLLAMGGELLVFLREPHDSGWLSVGFPLGLAILAKGTAYLFGLSMWLWFLVAHARCTMRGTWIPQVFLACFLVILPNVGHFARNQQLYGLPIGNQYGVYPETSGLATFVSNTIKNTASNLATPFPSVNAGLEELAAALHRGFGMDINDPGKSLIGFSFALQARSCYEDTAGNPWHLLLLGGTFLGLLFRPGSSPGMRRGLGISVLIGFALYSGLLVWQPWGTRLILPLYLLAAPLAGRFLSRLPTLLANLWLGCAFVFALPVLFLNVQKPVFPRVLVESPPAGTPEVAASKRTLFSIPPLDQRFLLVPSIQQSYVEVARAIQERGHTGIGLAIGNDSPEYLLWALLHNMDLQYSPGGTRHAVSLRNLRAAPRMEHIMVEDGQPVPPFPLGFFAPTAIISEKNWGTRVRIGGKLFIQRENIPGPLRLYETEAPKTPQGGP